MLKPHPNTKSQIMKPLFTLLFVALISTLFQPALYAQSQINGSVKNKEGEALVGATLVIKGTNAFTVADLEGRFSLPVKVSLPLVLNVSSVGYTPQDLSLTELPQDSLRLILADDNELAEIVITSRRREETAQQVPIPISVIAGKLIADAGAFNVNRLKEMIPSVQLYSSNPRNTTLNVRGLGSTFGLTNDGIDPGVGFYVDGVYYARPAATTLDFVDIEQIEVLRGPQGTLFGKNTTAGAFNIRTAAPSFKTGGTFEVSYGNYGFIQAKSSITGGLGKKFAGRLSFSGTQRDGVLFNVRSQKYTNDLNNLGLRAQLLFNASSKVQFTLISDLSSQRPDGYAQVVVGVAPTLRAPYRQFNQIIKDLEYKLPSQNPFDRIVDTDTPWRSNQDMGGISINMDAKFGKGTLSSTTAWRYWNWDPSNDRDFTGLPVLKLSQAPSYHQQYSQELRYAGEVSDRLSGVAGVFVLAQDLRTSPYHTEESGSAQWRFSQNSTSALWRTPGLLDGFGIRTTSQFNTLSAAVFTQLDWAFAKNLHLLSGLRYNYDEKRVDFNRQTYGGLQTTDAALLALKRSVYTDQVFNVQDDAGNFSGQVTLNYRKAKNFNAFATFSTNFKPFGLNLGGLPTASGAVLIDLARIKPEYVTHFEVGVKTKPSSNTTLNLTAYSTSIRDFQTQVQSPEVGVNRGYLANAERVRVQGVELDASLRLGKYLNFFGALTYTDGQYVRFANAPVPLEETGGTVAFKDISGTQLPGISKWAGSLGGELSKAGVFLNSEGKFFIAFDSYYRSGFSSSPSPSKYLNIEGYALLNARFGFRAFNGVSLFVWSRNLLDQDYFEQLLPAAGNAGHFAGVLGDPRTFGMTLRYNF